MKDNFHLWKWSKPKSAPPSAHKLSDLLAVNLLTENIEMYDPSGVVKHWLQLSKRSPKMGQLLKDKTEDTTVSDSDVVEFFDSDEEFDNVLTEKEVCKLLDGITSSDNVD